MDVNKRGALAAVVVFLALFLWLETGKGYHDIELEGDVKARIYVDARPHNLKTAPVQKGLVLLKGKEELIEEGLGFGNPVANYSGTFYFSMESEVRRKGSTIEKIFTINTIAQGASVDIEFKRAEEKGKVRVIYEFAGNAITVNVKPELEKTDLTSIIIANEQGPHYFTKFSDGIKETDFYGIRYVWERLNTTVASVYGENAYFSVSSSQKADLFLGMAKEGYNESFVGLNYIIQPDKAFTYEIKAGAYEKKY